MMTAKPSHCSRSKKHKVCQLHRGCEDISRWLSLPLDTWAAWHTRSVRYWNALALVLKVVFWLFTGSPIICSTWSLPEKTSASEFISEYVSQRQAAQPSGWPFGSPPMNKAALKSNPQKNLGTAKGTNSNASAWLQGMEVLHNRDEPNSSPNEQHLYLAAPRLCPALQARMLVVPKQT